MATSALTQSHDAIGRRHAPWMLVPSADPARQRSVRDSHERSRASGLSPDIVCDFSTQNAADFRITQERNARLFTQALPVMEMLMEQVSHSGSMVILSDGAGTILRTHCHGTFMEQAEKVALRSGVSWAENSKGTNAIGTALVMESDIVIHANEHFVRHNHILTCTASPIFDHTGNVIGVLDVTGDQRSYHPHTLGLVKLSAQTIENSWFRDNFRQSICLHFHSHPEMIGTVAEGILALDAQGQVLGANRAGLRFLGMPMASLRLRSLQESIGRSFEQLMQAFKLGQTHAFNPLTLQLTSGKRLYARISADQIQWPARSASRSKKDKDSPAKAVAQENNPLQNNELISHDLRGFSAHLPSKNSSFQGISSPRTALFVPRLDSLGLHDQQVQALVEKTQSWLSRHASSPLPMVLIGEAGVGKHTWALATHTANAQRSGAFVTLHCEGIGEDDWAQLQSTEGLLAQAQGGTLYLKDLDQFPLVFQSRLLRLLRDKRLPSLGDQAWDVALICSSQKSLRSLCEASALRMDFYHFVQAFSLYLPQLHERSDFAQLCDTLIRQHLPPELTPPKINAALFAKMQSYAWPGQLRQLSSVLQAALLLAHNETELRPEHFSFDFLQDIAWMSQHPAKAPIQRPAPSTWPLATANAIETAAQGNPSSNLNSGNLHNMELQAIQAAIAEFEGNVSKAARRLGISRNTIYRKLKNESVGSK